ncbi:hypothetical protein LTR86_000175 [Recurvomyces mirabilis]|nr:hypothetical protein LTR86_000175 [Recurvomyces mirabilis]
MNRQPFKDILLVLSDPQLLTGLTILLVGYMKLGTNTEYHFQIVSRLAKLAFVVHSTTIDVLLDRLLDPKRPFGRLWRPTAIMLFLALTFLALLPTGNDAWLSTWGLPARCIWQDTAGGYAPGYESKQMGLDMVLQPWGGVIVVYELFPNLANNVLERRFRLWSCICLRGPCQIYVRCTARLLDAKDAPSWICWYIISCISASIAGFVLIFTEIIFSQAFDLLRGWAMIVSNVYNIFYLRSNASREGREGSDNNWDFGQALPVLLLVSPLFMILETLRDYLQNIDDRVSTASQQSASAAYGQQLTEEPDGISSDGRVEGPFGHGSTITTSLPEPFRLDTESRGSFLVQDLQSAESSQSLVGVLAVTSARSSARSVWRRNTALSGRPSPAVHFSARPQVGLLAKPQAVWEDKLYEHSWFRGLLDSLMVCIYASVTYSGVQGYAF